jgi:RNA polymerase sigma-32 factor
MPHRRLSDRPSALGLSRALPPPLSPEDELALARAFRRTGDLQLRRAMVEANLRLIIKLAIDQDGTRGRLVPDLIQEGCLDLLEAVSRFDPERGVRLGAYAGFWIRAYMIGFKMANVRLVREARGRAGRRAFFRGEISPVELSLDSFGIDDGSALGERLPDPAPPVDQRLLQAEAAARANRQADALARTLGPRERAILDCRLRAEAPEPLRSVARRFGVSGERIRQLERDLLAALREGLDDERVLTAA